MKEEKVFSNKNHIWLKLLTTRCISVTLNLTTKPLQTVDTIKTESLMANA